MIPTKHTLFDDFTYRGKFWLPPAKRRKPRKVDGVLRVSGGSNIGLELFGELVGPGASADPRYAGGSPPVIHGQADDGLALTLFDSFWTSRNHGAAGHTRSEYTSNLLIAGAWFDGEHDIKLDKLRLGLTHLEGWQDVHPFREKRSRDDDAGYAYTVDYESPSDVTVELPDPRVTLKLSGTLFSHSQREPSVTLRHASHIDLTPAAPLCIEAAFRLVGDVQRLFKLLVGEPVLVRKLRGWVVVRDAAAARTRSDARKPHRRACDVFFNQSGTGGEKDLLAHRMTMPYKAVGDRFPRVVTDWFASLPVLRPVYDVFFATYRADRLYTESHFLNLAQVVESFDRRTNGGQYLPDPDYQVVYEALVRAIPRDVPQGLRDKMKKGTLRHANEYSLRKRLTGLLKALSAAERGLICEDVGEFAGPVVDTRNNLTHVLGEPPSGGDADILRDGLLRHASRKLELLTIMLMLRRLSLPPDLVVRQVTKCGRFDVRPFTLSRGE